MDLWTDFIYFFSFQDSSLNTVLVGTILLGLTAGIVGVLVVLNKKALMVDAISHSVLPGICLGFMLSGVKNPFYIVGGGILAGTAAVFLIDWIIKKSRIKTDASIAITLSFMFSLGVVLLNIIQDSGNSNQSGLTDFLFGKAATIVREDLVLFGALSLLVILTVPIFYRQFKISLFNSEFAASIGVNQNFVKTLISTLIIITTAIGIQTVGIILMSALIITPAATSFFWTNSFKKAFFISGTVAILSSLIGVFISFTSPKMPTGPWIIVVLSVIALSSAFLSPKGIVIKRLRLARNRRKIISDNLLKAVYKLNKKHKSTSGHTEEQIQTNHFFNANDLKKGLSILQKKSWILKAGDHWVLTDTGKQEAKRIIRIHRLWEVYMQKFMQIQTDHLHESAESIEHIFTPSLENELLKIMGKPTKDPHKQEIPYEE